MEKLKNKNLLVTVLKLSCSKKKIFVWTSNSDVNVVYIFKRCLEELSAVVISYIRSFRVSSKISFVKHR